MKNFTSPACREYFQQMNWTSHIWDFDDGYFSKKFFWNDAIIKFFDREINRKRIETLFGEIKPFITDEFDRNGYIAFWNEWHRRRTEK